MLCASFALFVMIFFMILRVFFALFPFPFADTAMFLPPVRKKRIIFS